jgi:SAM-dependent methyltransferase
MLAQWETEMKAESYDNWRGESERLKTFWNTRYVDFSLLESGIKCLTPEYSQLLYRCKKEAYCKALKIGGINTAKPIRILDGGCGQGFFAAVARQVFRAADYTGIDISEKAIAFLKTQFAGFKWVCADLSDPELTLKHVFDVAQSIEVLHLILDDTNHTQAIQNLTRHLAPNGILIITDTLPQERYFANDYIVFRPFSYYEQVLASIDMQLLGVFPMYYWVPDMGVAYGPLRRVCNHLPPKLVFSIDRFCLNLRLPQFAISHDSQMKMMVCRKKVGTSDK